MSVLCRRVPVYDSPSLDEAVEAVFAGSAKAGVLGPQSNVVIKPNLLAKHPPERAVTTHPAVLAACIRALQRRGVTHITVADSPGGPYNAAVMKSIYKTSGLAAVCEALGAVCYTACRSAPCQTDGALVRQFELLEPVLEADFLIDLCKVKTHVMTGMTCAVKNLFGCVPGLQKAELHMRFPEKERFGQMLVDLCEAVKPALVIADGVVAMEGDGPAGGEPRELGLLLGGEDPYAVDLAVCRLMGLSAIQVPYLAAAHAAGLCAAACDPAGLAGDVDAAAPVPGYQLPASYSSLDFSSSVPRPIRWIVPGFEKLVAPRPVIQKSKCIGCGKCAEICPGHTIAVQNGKAQIAPEHCIRCFCCHEMCPAKAIDVRRFGLFRL